MLANVIAAVVTEDIETATSCVPRVVDEVVELRKHVPGVVHVGMVMEVAGVVKADVRVNIIVVKMVVPMVGITNIGVSALRVVVVVIVISRAWRVHLMAAVAVGVAHRVVGGGQMSQN